jgi:hypothetical protein
MFSLIFGVAGGIVLGVYALRALARLSEWRNGVRMRDLTPEGQRRRERRAARRAWLAVVVLNLAVAWGILALGVHLTPGPAPSLGVYLGSVVFVAFWFCWSLHKPVFYVARLLGSLRRTT